MRHLAEEFSESFRDISCILNRMYAIVISEPGGPEVLQWREVPDLQPAPGEVRVAVRATAVNRLDLLQRKGLYPAPAGYPQDIPGVEFSGVIESLGADVVSFHVGDRVFGLSGGGTYAQFVISDELMLMPIPDGMSFVEAAAVPEAFVSLSPHMMA
jgi:NADPH:quinone reductase